MSLLYNQENIAIWLDDTVRLVHWVLLPGTAAVLIKQPIFFFSHTNTKFIGSCMLFETNNVKFRGAKYIRTVFLCLDFII